MPNDQTQPTQVAAPQIDESTITPIAGATPDAAPGPQIDESTITPIAGVPQPVQQTQGVPIPSDAKITAAQPKSFLDSLKDMFENSNPNYTNETNQAFQEHGPELLNLRAGSPQERAQHPILSKVDDWLSSMTSPTNTAMIAGSGGFGALLESLPKAGQILPRLISGGFSAQQIAAVVKNIPAAREAWSKGDVNGLESIVTQMTLDTAAGLMSGSHAIQGEAAAKPLYPGMDEAIRDYTQGAVDKTSRAAGEVTGKVAGKAGEAAAAVPGTLAAGVKPVAKTLGFMREIDEEMRTASPPTKGVEAKGYMDRMKQAMPQLIQIMQDEPNVSTNQEMVDAIENHRTKVDNTLNAIAGQQKGAGDKIGGVTNQIVDRLNAEFDRAGAEYKPEERAAAIRAVTSHMQQLAGYDEKGFPVYRDPNLFELEGIRKRFGTDSADVFGQPGVITPAEKQAKAWAANEARKAIDNRFTDLGIENVKEWRAQEAALIDVRDQLKQGYKKSIDAGNGKLSYLGTMIKSKGWGALPAALGMAAGGPIGAAGMTAAAYLHERANNPNKAIQRAADKAGDYGPSGAALPFVTPRFFQGDFQGEPTPGPTGGSNPEPNGPAGPLRSGAEIVRAPGTTPTTHIPNTTTESGTRRVVTVPQTPYTPPAQPANPLLGPGEAPLGAPPSPTAFGSPSPMQTLRNLAGETPEGASYPQESKTPDITRVNPVSKKLEIWDGEEWGPVEAREGGLEKAGEKVPADKMYNKLASSEPVGGVAPQEEPIQKTKNLPEGYDDRQLVQHELGHAIVGHMLGFNPVEILSDRHAEVGANQSTAATAFNFDDISTDKAGHLTPADIADKLDDFLTMYMGGGAAQEAAGGLPMEENLGMHGDKSQAASILKILGYTPEEISNKIDEAKDRAKQILSNPDVRATLDKYSAGREPGLDPAMHVSADKIARMKQELNQIQGGNNEGNGTADGEGVQKLNTAPVAGAEGGNPRQSGQQAADETIKPEDLNPAVKQTVPVVKGSTVQLRDNPLKIKPSEGDTPSTTDVAQALSKFTTKKLPVFDLDKASPEKMVARAKSLAEDEARYQLAQNNSGTAWYTDDMKIHDRVLIDMRPELAQPEKLSLFKMAEAVLSSGQKPYGNFKSAVKAWDAYNETGKFPPINPDTGKSWGPRGAAGYGNAMESINKLVDQYGEKGASDWLLAEHPVSELRQYNPSGIRGKADETAPGVMILGPKRGPFAQNLHGQEAAFTADMWVSRTWNRWMGTIEVGPDGEMTSDSPRNNKERDLMKQSFSETAEKLGLTTSALQAVLWYYEQALYSAHGSAKESWSFATAAERAKREEAENDSFKFGHNADDHESALSALSGK